MPRFREIAHTLLWVKRHLLRQHPVPEIDWLAHYIRPSDILIDVGAHAGAWTVALARLVPQGKVYAFEALPYYARILKATLRILGKRNAEVINKAVLDENKSIEIVWCDPRGNRLTGLTHVKAQDEQSGQTIVVEGLTLDTFLASFDQSVRFMKMDIEGAELLALQGAQKLLKTFRPVLYLELKVVNCQRYGYTPADLFTFLNTHQYRGYLYDNGSWQSTNPQTYPGNGDVWFVPVEAEKAFLVQVQGWKYG